MLEKASSEPFLLGVAAMVAFGMTMYLLYKNKTAAASVGGALAFLAMVISHFSQIDSVGALSVYVKLNNKVIEANNILEKLQKISILDAQLAFSLAAWSSRLGGMPNIMKQKLLDKFINQLTDEGVSDYELDEIVRPHVNLIAHDFIVNFATILYDLDARKYISNSTNKSANDAAKLILQKRDAFDPNQAATITLELLKSSLRELNDLSIMSDDERNNMMHIMDDIVGMYAECLKKHGYTDASIKFLMNIAIL